jgi:hypothetical protein
LNVCLQGVIENDEIVAFIRVSLFRPNDVSAIPSYFSLYAGSGRGRNPTGHFTHKSSARWTKRSVHHPCVAYSHADQHDIPGAGFSTDDGASLLMAFRGLQAESVAQGEAHKSIAKELHTLVADPFQDWAQGYRVNRFLISSFSLLTPRCRSG